MMWTILTLFSLPSISGASRRTTMSTELISLAVQIINSSDKDANMSDRVSSGQEPTRSNQPTNLKVVKSNIRLLPSGIKPKVTVVGCGVAGALTALELAKNHNAEVTVIDREDDCGVGTSGRIAAEMMFYSLDKELMWDKESMYKMWKRGQVNASSVGAISRAVNFMKKNEALGEKKIVKFSSWDPSLIVFEPGDAGPKVRSVGEYQTWKKHCADKNILGICKQKLQKLIGYHLDGIEGVSVYKLYVKNDNVKMQELLKTAFDSGSLKLTFRKSDEPRASLAFQAALFESAGKRLQEVFLPAYPKLCEAVITPFCCENEKTKQWVEDNTELAGYSCELGTTNATSDPGMGVAHVFYTKKHAEQAKQAASKEDSTYDFKFFDKESTKEMLSEYVLDDAQYGALVTRGASGFVRTEKFFTIIKEILKNEFQATFKFGTEIRGITVADDGVTINTRVWDETDRAKWEVDAKTGHWDLHNVNDITTVSEEKHDRVVITTGAALDPWMKTLDPMLSTELMPMFGCIAVSQAKESIIPEIQSKIGVVHEELHQYLRATREGQVAIGGGAWFGHPDEDYENVRKLPYRRKSFWRRIIGMSCDGTMEQSGIGKKVVNARPVKKLGGARPMSYLKDFPLLKLHQSERLVIHTGAGANGYVISWKSAELAAQILMTGTTKDDMWKASFDRFPNIAR